jgi:hypothetical protein
METFFRSCEWNLFACFVFRPCKRLTACNFRCLPAPWVFLNCVTFARSIHLLTSSTAATPLSAAGSSPSLFQRGREGSQTSLASVMRRTLTPNVLHELGPPHGRLEVGEAIQAEITGAMGDRFAQHGDLLMNSG